MSKKPLIKCSLREAPRYLAATVSFNYDSVNTIVPVRFGATDPRNMQTTSNDADIRAFLKEMFNNLVDEAEIVLEEDSACADARKQISRGF